METVIGKAIDLVCEYMVIPIARQFKYVCSYKSCVMEMKDASHKLQNEKEIVDQEKSAAKNDGQLIYKKADDWLEDVTKTQEEVSSLMTYEEGIAAKMSGCSIGGQILNPIARHKLGRKATKRKHAIEDLRRERPRPTEIFYPPPPPGIVNVATASAAPAKQQTEGVFRSSRWDEIIEKIMTAFTDNSINVIGLYGMGGVGKSTMINEVYDQVKKQGMFDEVAKVEVKAKPEIKRIQEEIAFSLGLRFQNESSTIRAGRLSQRLLSNKDEKNDTHKEKKKTVLIILDDLWEVVDLQEVGIPLGGSNQVQIKLLLTSRDKYLLSDKMRARDPVHLDVLSDADALRMFKFFVGVGAEGVEADKVVEIARKCSGLPIVIEATAKALENKDPVEWAKTLKRLHNDDVLEKLKVSYDYLRSKEIKDLFLICGIVRGQRIQVRDLLKYTFGLGFYEGREDIHSLADAESELEKLLSDLEAASMLLKRDDSLYVNIHDHMRDLAVRIVDRDRLEWVHFTLRDDSYKLPRKFEASKLELLLSYCEEVASIQVPELFFKEMKKLYVLEFTNLRGALPSSPNKILDHLRNLGTLCLHNCSLDDISMIGELKGLQILSFRGSNIRNFPIQLRELTSLKMLDLSNCTKLTKIEPNVLGSLTKLEELNMENSFKDWEINQEDDARPPSNARLIELKNMSLLSNVKIHIRSTSMLPKDDKLFSSKLATYMIKLGDIKDWDIIGIRGYQCDVSKVLMLQLDDSPNVLQLDWVQTTLQRTEVLFLNGSLDGKCESIDELCAKGFECLKHLEVRNCPSIRCIVSSNSCSNFMDLETVSLQVLENLEKLCYGETLSKLKVTMVERCNKLTHLFNFSVLNCNSELEEIIIEDCKEIHCIVIDEDDKNYDVVKLSKLQRLELRWLPKFQAFCVPQGPQPPMKVLFSGRKVAFPCLESLVIFGLDELEDIWHPTNRPTELGELRSLHVRHCNRLVCVINSNVLMRLEQHLESLTIESCASIEHVFEVEDDTIVSGTSTTPRELFLFSKVKELRLDSMYRLKSISKNLMIGRDCVLTIFPNIKSLNVSFCTDLRYVLSSSLLTGVGGFQLLKGILIRHCDKMEAVIVVMVMGEETQQAAMRYSSLERLCFESFSKLKTFCWYYSCGKSDQNMVPSTEHYNIITTSQQDHDASPFFSQKETFPCLETLRLDGLKELRQIWPHEVVAAQEGSFYNLKEVVIQICPKLLEVFPSTLIECLQKLESISVSSCDLVQSIIVNEKKIKPRLTMEAGQGQHQAIVHGSSNSIEAASVTMEIIKFTFPCLRQLEFSFLPNLDTFYSSSSATVNLPSMKTLKMASCPKVKTLFIQRPPAVGLVRSDDDDDLDSNGVETAFFGYCDKQAQSIPNLKLLNLDDLESFTGIWKTKSDDESCLDRVELQQVLGGKVEDGEFCMHKLESLKLGKLPNLKWNISISDKKCSTIINNNNTLPSFKEHVLFPSLQNLRVQECDKVKLVDSDNVYTTIEQFSIQAIPSPFRSIELEISCKNGEVELKMIDEYNMRFGKKQHLHLTLMRCKTSYSSCMNLLPLTSPSFCNVLTQLTVGRSDGLKYLLTPLGATSLVHLTYLTIEYCNNIKEIVVVGEEAVDNVNGGEEEEEEGRRRGDIREITFNHLKDLTLRHLKKLESFSFSSMDLNFPSLEKLTIDRCRQMRIFSNGIVTTPKLHQVKWSEWDAESKSQLKNDLNATILKKFQRPNTLFY